MSESGESVSLLTAETAPVTLVPVTRFHPADGSDPASYDLPLAPGSREKRGATGTPVVLGDGEEWLLAHGASARDLDRYRDRIFDQSTLRGNVETSDIQPVAWSLLRVNYLLSGSEAAGLVVEADPTALANAVIDALFGAERNHLKYSEWFRSALAANGLDAAAIDPELLPLVLRHLVQTGRAVPAAKFISSLEAVEYRRAFLEGR